MIAPDIPDNESSRIAELQALHILDTPPEERFDRVTRLTQKMFDVPMCFISFIDSDRQWYKSTQGTNETESCREASFCGHAILSDDVLTVDDHRFSDNPAVAGEPHIRFYAGAPIIMPSGNRLGTLCIVDTEPRSFCKGDEEILRDFCDLIVAELINQQEAATDSLTGVFNRRGFEMLAEKAVLNARRYGWDCCLMYIDINRFKSINDTYGHTLGDRALKSICKIISFEIRESDILGRLGGDEFAVMMINCTEPKAQHKAAILIEAVDEFNSRSHLPFDLSISYGIVQTNPHLHQCLGDVMHQADMMMYQYKRALASQKDNKPRSQK